MESVKNQRCQAEDFKEMVRNPTDYAFCHNTPPKIQRLCESVLGENYSVFLTKN